MQPPERLESNNLNNNADLLTEYSLAISNTASNSNSSEKSKTEELIEIMASLNPQGISDEDFDL